MATTKQTLSKYGKILGHEGGIVTLRLHKGIFSPSYKKKKAAMPTKKKTTKKRATTKKSATKKKATRKKTTAKRRTTKRKK